MSEVLLVGAAIKIGRGCWRILQDGQEQFQQDERIVQLEQAAAHSPDEARQIAEAVINEAQQAGQNIDPGRAEAVKDLIAIMPAQIRERTRATINHARRHGTAMATVLPVTTHFAEAEREAFYTNLFPQRRSQFRAGDSIPHHNPEWHLERMLGAGGFGEVWLARHQFLTDQPPWAVKFCQDENSAAVLKREANNLYALRQKLPVNNKHIVMLLELQLTTMPYWLAFEYIDGGTLESQMRLGPMDWPTAWSVFQPILVGMSIVHSLGIVHRDLKPANILLDSHQRPRIADFGIGKILAERDAAAVPRSQNSFTTAGCGTISYMSQEQANGEPAHPSDDVYALGIILWQMLAGKLTSLGYIDDIKILNAPKEIKKSIAACVFYPRARRPSDAKLLLSHIVTSINAEKVPNQSQVTQPQQPVQPSSPVPVVETKPKTKPVSQEVLVKEVSVPEVLNEDRVKEASEREALVMSKIIKYDDSISNMSGRLSLFSLVISNLVGMQSGWVFGVLTFFIIGILVVFIIVEPIKRIKQLSVKNSINSLSLTNQEITNIVELVDKQEWKDNNTKQFIKELLLQVETKPKTKPVRQVKSLLNIKVVTVLKVVALLVVGIAVIRFVMRPSSLPSVPQETHQDKIDADILRIMQAGDEYANQKNYVEAAMRYRTAAERGHASGQYNLGVMYHNGYGVTQDYSEAVKWYRKAAEQGDATSQFNLGFMYQNGHGVTQDYSEAVKWYFKAAEQGDVSGQYNLGVMYRNGYGVTQDYSEAVKWYRKAAEQGDADGQYSLGFMYQNGYGVTQDYSEAVKWYRKAAEQGNASGQNQLGLMYHNGYGVTQDYSEAVKWYRKAAEQGFATSQFNLGLMYHNGYGVTQDYSEAVKWYRKAAEQGFATSQFNLGLMYHNGYGVTQDYSEAVKWFRTADEQGDADGQNQLGVMYDNGQGVTQDDREAVKWYRKAAEQGHASGQYNLGAMYNNGEGVTQDYSEAVKWYRKAAEQGNASGQNNLGFMYLNGYGVTQDYSEAVKWFRKAADQGIATSQNNLGFMYQNGKGVTQDYSEAVKWYRKAAEQGNANAKEQLKKLGL